ncbi:MAG: tetratricopeptide repeat protein [Flavobacteriaceae bacterium]|nr:tetratricopeptide repeat protein [Flavobacteriaceae bacterium]
MGTYKKKGFKSKNSKDQLDEQSTTAEVFTTLEESASKSEQWIEKNSKPLFSGLIIVAALILGFLGYNKYIIEPTEKEAANELAFPRKYFNDANEITAVGVDSLLNLGLEGADGKYGFLDIATMYSSTKAGNLANYYAGLSYLKLKKYDKAIEHLSAFSSDDLTINPVSLGVIGDAFADINQLDDAIDYYEKAAKTDNSFTAPLYLFKAAQLAMHTKKFSKAESLFTKIKTDYPSSTQGADIDKYINSAKFASKN